MDWRACGLEGYGKPTGYLERQLRRFNGLWEHNKTRELPVVEEVGEWLGAQPARVARVDDRARRLPARQRDGGRRPRPRELVAIFDWELSTIGDPLADVGYLTVTWVEPDDPADTMFANLSAPSPARERLPDARRADRALRGAQRPLDVGAQLVPGARAVEGGRVHGGQLQALPRPAPPTTSTWRCSTRACPSSPRRPGEIAQLVKGLLVDFGGVLTTNVFDSFRDFCVAEGLDPRRDQAAVPRATRGRSSCVRGLETRRADRGASSRERFGELLELERPARGLVDRMFGGIRAGRARWSRRCAGARGARHPHRPDLELDGRRPLRPLHLPRAVRRRRDLRRRGHAQARSPRSTCSARARRASRRPTACSWTTCARTARAPRRSG